MRLANKKSGQGPGEDWRRENDFSDWLVTETDLSFFAAELGIERENPRRECTPRDFPCDIVGNVVGNGAHKAEIEAAIGAPLFWKNNEGENSAKILLEAKIDSRQENNMPQVKEWFYKKAFNFYQVFRPRIWSLQEPIPQANDAGEVALK
jgi:hypothetical protein